MYASISLAMLCTFAMTSANGGVPDPFEGSADVGIVSRKGDVKVIGKTISVSAAGENMWAARDAFHFVWRKMEGDFAIASDIRFEGQGKDPHRKACLMIRRDLDADSAYVDVAVHGDGLTSLQFREVKGGPTREVQINVPKPNRVRLVKRGQYTQLYAAAEGDELVFTGAAVRIDLPGLLYVGLAVCAHDRTAYETAVFSRIDFTTKFPETKKQTLYSTLEVQSMTSTDRRVVYVTPSRIEAPNWLRDGTTLLYNAGGKLYRIPAAGGIPVVVDTGFAIRCNNDHGLSPDGKTLAISDQSQGDRKSRIYTLPVEGGVPKLITVNGPSYWHGWSPDGKTLIYCAERNGEFDIYTIPTSGGEETRLTTAKGLDDGPEYSPDGKTIYFNSDRTGQMHLWKMMSDGKDQTQLTNDDFNNWFPHPSPDGRSLVFLSFEKHVKGHPENQHVTLRRMTLANHKIDVLGRFFGGQGTINVPCFSPDGRKIAFVTYQLIP
jgi:TolB protein